MRIPVIIFYLFVSLSLNAQVVFKTIAPQQPVGVGDPFQVQFIIQDGEPITNFRAPDFSGFKLVTGPNFYAGSDHSKRMKNSVYTLTALAPGRLIIRGATATVNGQMVRSNDVVIQVISQEETARRLNKNNPAINAEYFLRPGDDPYQRIKDNLFVKVLVDKKNCFVGEPVTATFKLYSRLESKSDITKNPGFYGFTVYDMVNLSDRQTATEKWNGQLFDVHTIRKVQLYPLREGEFSIDAMEVKNKVEFSRSAVSKKTEQEVIEGVLGTGPDDAPKAANTEEFENSITTDPILINVKPLPIKTRPSSFNGATGFFNVSGSVIKDRLLKNEQGVFELTISGKGNFIQISAPVIQWPNGIEGFEPVVADTLDKSQSPLKGSRVFRYSFVSSASGVYEIPSIAFSFFNPDSGSYKMINTRPLSITVSGEEIKAPLVSQTTTPTKATSKKYFWVIGAVVIVALAGFFLWRRKKTIPDEQMDVTATLSIEALLSPIYSLINGDNSNFYDALSSAIWKFSAHYFDLTGSEMKKDSLAITMHKLNIPVNLEIEFLEILQKTETGMYTRADMQFDRKLLLEKTERCMIAIVASLNS